MKTDRIYYTDSYRRSFKSHVLDVTPDKQGTLVRLDSTCFYPASGGQPADKGRLGGLPVLDVFEEGERVTHLVGGSLEVRTEVKGELDWAHRFDHMQQHTGQHILSQAFLQTVHSSTESFHMGTEVSTLDLDRGELTPEQIYRAEDLANSIVFENRSVSIHFLNSEEANHFPMRKPPARKGPIRVIEIADFDYSACGGTHCRTTGEVGLIKVRRWERIKKRARVEFYCGRRALEDYRRKNRMIYQLTQLLSVSEDELAGAARQQLERSEQRRKETAQLRRVLLQREAAELFETSSETAGLQVVCSVWEDREIKEIRELALQVVKQHPDVLVLFGIRSPRPTLLFARSPEREGPDLRKWIETAARAIRGKGGGSPHLVQAAGSCAEGLEPSLEQIMRRLSAGG